MMNVRRQELAGNDERRRRRRRRRRGRERARKGEKGRRMKAFMDIDVGDQEQQRQRYEKYVQFRSFVVGKALKQLGRQVAEQGDDEKMMESLSEDDVELCASMFEGDPSYSGGEIQKRVPSLRVGRVIIDLDYEKVSLVCN